MGPKATGLGVKKWTQIQILSPPPPALATDMMPVKRSDMIEPRCHLLMALRQLHWHVSEDACEGPKLGALTKNGYCLLLPQPNAGIRFHCTDTAAVNASMVLPLTPPLPVSSLTLPLYQPGRGGNIVSSVHLHCSVRCSIGTRYLSRL